jgi:hypothetical protein
MNCCSECFTDTEIRAIINANKKTGKCDFCGSTNVNIFPIKEDQTIAELFDGLLDIYSPVSELPNSFPREKTDLIKNILCNDWRIFTLKPDKVYRLITTLCSERYKEQPELFDNPVGIRHSQDHTYMAEHSILKNNCWDDFVEGIKRKNRFHSDHINTEKLFVFLRCAAERHKKGEVFFRSRICPDNKGFSRKEMGPPPESKIKAGRVNPTGISVLYLSDSIETTLYEIRAGVYDYVSIGRFTLLKDIDVINLAGIDHISPFIGIDYGFDFIQYAININHLRMIAQEIAKPLRNDNELDYIPTQYISDFIRSKGYDGIEYISTMRKTGSNLAVFDSTLFKCTSTSVYDVQTISYSYTKLQ